MNSIVFALGCAGPDDAKPTPSLDDSAGSEQSSPYDSENAQDAGDAETISEDDIASETSRVPVPTDSAPSDEPDPTEVEAIDATDTGNDEVQSDTIVEGPIETDGVFQTDTVMGGETDAENTAVETAAVDLEPPTIGINAGARLITSEGILTLTADAFDNVAMTKVVFEQDGVIIGEDSDTPYTFDLAVSAALNGRHAFSATAVDGAGNQTADKTSVLVAIDNRFFGTAPNVNADYASIPHFMNQITPANAGKWGTVERIRDEMDFGSLDTAYQFAQDNGFRFKLHTLVWHQQQPDWISDLPAEEQLSELNEWMAAIATGYPNIDMIDVVNEPLHGAPSYKEALGGDGETGWDWVVTAFEMAREYFPNSELLLNDYSIIVQPQFTESYLEIIHILLERELIDGIGIQAHFLERTDIAEVERNVATLAATGLPIYVAELDVAIEDDAHQANQLSALMTTFMGNDAVLGITHWGHFEGDVWRQDAYLVNADGSYRPALEWWACIVGSTDGCSVPEYIPDPRIGNHVALRLEGEEYSAASGVIATDTVVAWSDAGDWVRFDSVNFNENYNTFYFGYARGNTGNATVSIHLDGIESDPALTMTLSPTATWNTIETVVFPWTPVTGEHDLFIFFHDIDEVANIDYLAFGRPSREAEEGAEQIVIESESYDYQEGIEKNGDVIGSADTGDYLVYGNVVVDGYTLVKTLYGRRVEGSGEAEVRVGEVDGPVVATLTLPSTGDDAVMAEVEATLALRSGMYDLYIVFTGDNTGSFDSFVLIQAEGGANLISNGTFEVDTNGWSSWGGTLETSTDRAHGGMQSLLVTNRAAGGENAIVDLIDIVTPGETYNTSMWVMLDGATMEERVNTTAKTVCDGIEEYTWLAVNDTMTDGQWIELKGTLTAPDCNYTTLIMYVEGPSAGIDMYVDDVSVRKPTVHNIVSTGNFETGFGGWSSWGGTLQISTEEVHGGDQSLLVTDRSDGSETAVYPLTDFVTLGTTYHVSVWVLLSGATSDETVVVTQKIMCDGIPSYFWIANSDAVPADTWVEFAGPMMVPECNDLGEILIYIEGPSAGVDLHVDDVAVYE